MSVMPACLRLEAASGILPEAKASGQTASAPSTRRPRAAPRFPRGSVRGEEVTDLVTAIESSRNGPRAGRDRQLKNELKDVGIDDFPVVL